MQIHADRPCGRLALLEALVHADTTAGCPSPAHAIFARLALFGGREHMPLSLASVRANSVALFLPRDAFHNTVTRSFPTAALRVSQRAGTYCGVLGSSTRCFQEREAVTVGVLPEKRKLRHQLRFSCVVKSTAFRQGCFLFYLLKPSRTFMS
jgi:hypothetical protein